MDWLTRPRFHEIRGLFACEDAARNFGQISHVLRSSFFIAITRLYVIKYVYIHRES